MLKSVIGRLRVIGLCEGISFLLLLAIAMPLKYSWGMPIGVRIAGSVHGALFLLYLAALAQAAITRRWSIGRVFMLFLAAMVPFGTFKADASLKLEQEAATA